MQYAGVDTQQFHHCIWFLFLCYINWTHGAFFWMHVSVLCLAIRSDRRNEPYRGWFLMGAPEDSERGIRQLSGNATWNLRWCSASSTSVSMRWRIGGPRLTCSTKLWIALGKSFWVRVRHAHFCTDLEMSFGYILGLDCVAYIEDVSC